MHADAALKHGATREEIDEALDVAVAINAGAALVFSARVMDVVDAHPLGAGIHQQTGELRTRWRYPRKRGNPGQDPGPGLF